MTLNCVGNQHFGLSWLVKRLFVHVAAMLYPVRNESCPILERPRLCSQPRPVHGRLFDMLAQRRVAMVSVVGERENRNWIAVVEPKQNCRFQLRPGNRG